MIKFNGRVGNGNAVHLVTQYTREDGLVFFITGCGADHATNRSVPRYRKVSDLDLTKITCRRCLLRQEGAK